jgi:hypothetical protein
MRQRGSSSPDALLGVVWNLPGGVTGVALHAPVVRAQAVLDLQDVPEHSGFGLGGELALPRVAAGLRVERVEPSAAGGRHAVMVLGALTSRDPMTALDLAPIDLDAGIGLHWLVEKRRPQ